MGYIYITEIEAIDPKDGKLKKWAGQVVNALTEKEARKHLDENGFGYCKIIGRLVSEIPCKKGSYEPDFDNEIDYENYKLN